MAGDSLWLMEPRGLPERRCAKGSPCSSLGKALDVRVFFLRLNEISPGLTSLPGPGEKQLGSRVPEKDEGMKREKINLWWNLVHGAAPHMRVQRDCHHPLGDATHPEEPRRPRRLGRTARQSVHRRPGWPARQAAFPEAGLGVCCSDGHD